MRKLISIVKCAGITGCVLLAASVAASSADLPRAAEHSRTVVVTEKSVVPVAVALNQTTLIVLPQKEKVMTTFGLNGEDWEVQSARVPTRYVAVKPKEEREQGTLSIVTDHGSNYSFLFTEVSGTGKPYDVKIFVAPDSQLQQKIDRPPKFVPAMELQKYRQEAAQAESEEKAEKAASAAAIQSGIAAFQSKYPGQLRFDYTWSRKKGQRFGVKEIFHDKRFTYIRADPNETPSLYEWKDGKPSLINFQYANGLYVVPKILDAGYLALGKRHLVFRRAGGGM
ncbi:MAG TPA: TrbG/VirB9 family P-type conjugative transfer protein [Bryobacteraceae bacterium]